MRPAHLVLSVLLASFTLLCAQQKPTPVPAAKGKPLVADADRQKSWPLASSKLPVFPALPAGKGVDGGLCHEVVRSSPQSHLAALAKVPLFLFAAEDDDNTPFADHKAFVEQLRGAKGNVAFEHVPTGGHYEAMLDPGLGKAIAWAQKLVATAPAAPGKKD